MTKKRNRKKRAGAPRRRPRRPVQKRLSRIAVGGLVLVLVALIAAALWFLFEAPDAAETPAEKEGFVTVKGHTFVQGGAPYRFAGVNLWQGAYLGAEIIKGGRARLERELDLMKANGITNLRVTAAAERSPLDAAVRPAFQEALGKYNEKLLVGLDVLLDEMAKREMKAVLVMGNYWEWSGGMAQYHAWTSGTAPVNPSVSGGTAFMAFASEFYRDKAAIAGYDRYVAHVIGRTNTVNGRRYADDPTIMAWQLANEPRPHPRGRKERSFLEDYMGWIETTARKIKRLAPNQLVSIGNEGTMGSHGDETLYTAASAFDDVDYMTFHIWPKNWQWYLPGDENKTLDSAIEKTLGYFDRHVAFAKKLDKPIVLEEFGLARDDEKTAPDAPVTARDAFLGAIFDAVEKDAKADGPVAGTNFWSWGGEGRAHSPDGRWAPGLDFTGDPPQEPQGLNSIFDTDKSTLTLIKAHAAALR